ncbi:MAG: DUF4249 domain-containing protein [Bacteroidales bacterium]|nr:DUF4249 domain-containing protein [Bacteroidales bacterium]
MKAKSRFNAHIILIVATLTFVTGLWSCQKVIQVNLNSAAPQLVIDASISDQPGPDTVTLSQTVNFNQDNIFPPVTGATVVISDNFGNIDTLKEVDPGKYLVSKMRGIPGRTYFLNVNVNGALYSATSTMPFPVPIDSIAVEKISGQLISNKLRLLISFHDPKGIENYYRILEKILNTQPIDGVIQLPTLGNILTDRLLDGTEINYSAISNQPKLVVGDTVLVSLQSVDKNMYNYFRTVQQNGSMSTTLSNPVTNLTNGALGYFSAYSVRTETVVIPDF